MSLPYTSPGCCALSLGRRERRFEFCRGPGVNPEAGLPHNFDLHYQALRQPRDTTEFVTALRVQVDGALPGSPRRRLSAPTRGHHRGPQGSATCCRGETTSAVSHYWFYTC
jgi:hypothetical protein